MSSYVIVGAVSNTVTLLYITTLIIGPIVCTNYCILSAQAVGNCGVMLQLK